MEFPFFQYHIHFIVVFMFTASPDGLRDPELFAVPHCYCPFFASITCTFSEVRLHCSLYLLSSHSNCFCNMSLFFVRDYGTCKRLETLD